MSAKEIVSIVRSDLPVDAARITEMVREALDLIGNIETFVQAGSSVVIKPNIFTPMPPPVSIDRRVLGALVRLCRDAGAREVLVVEGVSVGSLRKRVNIEKSVNKGSLVRGMGTGEVMRLLGITRAVEDAGGKVLFVEDLETERIPVPDGKVLHEVDYPKVILDADVFIDLPALKTHTMTMVTLGIKNLQGLLTEADRYFGHRDDLDQHLVDILKVRKPDVTLVDGLIAMEGMGAGESGTPVPMGLVLAGMDVVAVDSVCARVMGIENPLVVNTTRIAASQGLGVADPNEIETAGQTVETVAKKLQLPINFTQPIETLVTGVYPNIDVYIGGACRLCWLMAAMALPQLLKIDKRSALIVGVDPKIPPKKDWDLQNTFILGDCALGSAGPTRELRNRIALAGYDTFLPGCLPYQQAMMKLERILLDRGIIAEQDLIDKMISTRKRFFDYYKQYDPSWEPVT